MDLCGFTWVPASSYEFLRVPTSSYEFLRVPASSYEFLRVPTSSYVDLDGFKWIYIDFDDFEAFLNRAQGIFVRTTDQNCPPFPRVFVTSWFRSDGG